MCHAHDNDVSNRPERPDHKAGVAAATEDELQKQKARDLLGEEPDRKRLLGREARAWGDR